MKEKRTLYSEAAYFLGIFILAFGTAFMERADFGMSMVVAPAYLVHLKVSQYLPWFSFGMSEYVFQALVLILLSLVMHRAKRQYLLSFVTAFIYGLALDGAIAAAALIPFAGIAWRIVFYLIGMVLCSLGVALLFYTYFPPEAYEMFVKECAQKYGMTIEKTKTIYDLCSCALGIVLSLCFFGTFVGVKWGTVICALINGWLIGRISSVLEKKFIFKDALMWRSRIDC